MTDYGHSLKFGTVLSPLADKAADLVAQAQLADAEGLDLVGVIDHPYRPDFLDALTLMAYIAGRTERITVFSDVACLPLRPPALLAKAAASLALLSRDRSVLGLGAGGLWPDIASIGGPVRSPREAVQALSEAIDVIRSLTAGAEKTDYPGKFYKLGGAAPGPVPENGIQLWIGAFRPKMFQLIGEKGDGWIPSDLFLSPAGLAEGNQRIDDAALASGRRPSNIRRLYNISGHFGSHTDGSGFLDGTPQLWAEQLAELALNQGISGFILSPGDNPAEQLQIFAREVAPAVKHAVAKARSPQP